MSWAVSGGHPEWVTRLTSWSIGFLDQIELWFTAKGP